MTERSGPIDRTLALSVRSRDSRHVSPVSNVVRQISTVAKLTGRSGKTDRTLKPQRPVVSSKLPKACFFDRTRPVHLDRTQTASGAQPLATVPPSQRDRTQAVSVRCFWIQRPNPSQPYKLGGRERGTQTHLNPTNTLCTCGSIFTQILSRVLALH